MAGFLAWLQGDNKHAEFRTKEALAIAETVGNAWMAATNYNGLALIAWRAGDTRAMRQFANAALPVHREVGDHIAEVTSLIALAIADRLDSRLAEAAALFDQGHRLAEQSGFLWLAAAASFGSGEVALDRGQETDAVRHYRDSLVITADLGDLWGIGAAVGGIACVAALRGQSEHAARLFAAADALLASGRTFLPTLNRVRYDRLKAQVRRELGSRAFTRNTNVGCLWSTENAVTEARAITEAFSGDGSQASTTLATSVQLAPQERKVVRLIVNGSTNAEIARELGLSVQTVPKYVARICKKLGVHNRAGVAASAIKNRLV
jgi:DNA-binding NarL/FixJ family response regulator